MPVVETLEKWEIGQQSRQSRLGKDVSGVLKPEWTVTSFVKGITNEQSMGKRFFPGGMFGFRAGFVDVAGTGSLTAAL